MAQPTGNGYQVLTDVDQYQDTPIGTPDFVDICPISVDVSTNETVDTFSTLCSSESITSNVVTELDLTWSITYKYDTTNTSHSAILSKEFTTDRTYPFQIIDNVKGETIDFNGNISALSYTRENATVLEVSFDLKVADGAITVT